MGDEREAAQPSTHTQPSPAESRVRPDWGQAQGREPGDSSKYRPQAPPGPVDVLQQAMERWQRKARQLLSPPSRGERGRTGISKAGGMEGNEDGESRESRAAQPPLMMCNMSAREEKRLLAGTSVFNQEPGWSHGWRAEQQRLPGFDQIWDFYLIKLHTCSR